MADQYKKFTFSYGYDGGQWAFDLFAKDSADAIKRLEAIKAWGKYDGEIMAEIPAGYGGGVVARFMCWVRNAFAS